MKLAIVIAVKSETVADYNRVFLPTSSNNFSIGFGDSGADNCRSTPASKEWAHFGPRK